MVLVKLENYTHLEKTRSYLSTHIELSSSGSRLPQKMKREWLGNTLQTCSTSLVIREIQIETTLSFHIILARMTKINKVNNSSW